MEKDSERLFQEITILSKNIFISCLVLVFGAFILSGLEANWFSSISIKLAILIISVSLVIPGLFIVFRRPCLAQAWLIGISPFYASAIPWSQLSSWKKFGVYFTSILLSTTAVIMLITTLINTSQK